MTAQSEFGKMIEAQEKAGQAALVASTMLPRDMGDQRPFFERLGFRFEDVGDGLFVKATMPEGWRKERTDHDMWSRIVDENGQERATIFYKAAFYDRRAHMKLSSRFHVDVDYTNRAPGPRVAKLIDRKTGTVLHSATRESNSPYDSAYDAERDVWNWFNENLPDKKDRLVESWFDD